MRDLIERLEKATGPDRDLDGDIAVAVGKRGKLTTIVTANDASDKFSINYAAAYTASLDSALTLVPEGMEWHISNRGQIGASHLAFAGVYGAPMLGSECDTNAATPAIAVCIAALEARLALSTTRGEP